MKSITKTAILTGSTGGIGLEIARSLAMQGWDLRKELNAGATTNRHSVVVNFSSIAMNGVKDLDVATLTNPESIGGLMGAYAKSKAALTAVSRLMKEELLEDSILIEIVGRSHLS